MLIVIVIIGVSIFILGRGCMALPLLLESGGGESPLEGGGVSNLVD